MNVEEKEFRIDRRPDGWYDKDQQRGDVSRENIEEHVYFFRKGPRIAADEMRCNVMSD